MQQYFFWNQSFQCLVFVALQLQLVFVLREKFLGLYEQNDEVPILILISVWKSYFCYLQCFKLWWLG